MFRTSSSGRRSIETVGGGEGPEGLEDFRDSRCIALRSGISFSPPVQYSNILVKRATSERVGSDDKSLAALIPIIVMSPDIAEWLYEPNLLHLVFARG